VPSAEDFFFLGLAILTSGCGMRGWSDDQRGPVKEVCSKMMKYGGVEEALD
jgi:hypothetical protein